MNAMGYHGQRCGGGVLNGDWQNRTYQRSSRPSDSILAFRNSSTNKCRPMFGTGMKHSQRTGLRQPCHVSENGSGIDRRLTSLGRRLSSVESPHYQGTKMGSSSVKSDNLSCCFSKVRRADVRSRVIVEATMNGDRSDAGSNKGIVAVTGATGLIGTRLVEELQKSGYKVRVLTRNPSSARSKLRYPGLEFFAPTQWPSAVRGTRAVVNLAGEPIATRWTPELKNEIKRSRIQTTSAVVSAINKAEESERPEVLISSSAVGYYGPSETATFNENSGSGRDYLSEVCREWESTAEKADSRVVILRTGIVLAKEGGALSKMIPVFQIFAGGPLGTGKQWCSWIHRDDVVGLILTAIEDKSWSGPYNATAPNPVRMGELCEALGQVMGRPSFFPVPDFALKTLLGEGAQVVLDGQRVLPAQVQKQGYQFKYSRVHDALRNIMR